MARKMRISVRQSFNFKMSVLRWASQRLRDDVAICRAAVAQDPRSFGVAGAAAAEDLDLRVAFRRRDSFVMSSCAARHL